MGANLQRKTESNFKHILYVLHDDFKAGMDNFVGGTQLHVADIIKETYGFIFSVLSRHGQYLYYTYYEDTKEKYELRFFVGGIDTDAVFYSERFAEIYRQLLNLFQVDLVHIHHFKNHTLDIAVEAKKLNIPIVITLHDYYMACPTINLIDAQNKYCEGKTDEERCRACTALKLNKNQYIINDWRTLMSPVFEIADRVIAPSESLKKVFEECYPVLRGKIFTIPHGEIEFKRKDLPKRIGGILHVAFLGGMVEHKGSHLAKELILSTKGQKIQWHIFGQIYDPALASLDSDNLIKHGRYAKKDLFQLLIDHNINVTCILSICPESFCYTLSEAWQCNIPAVVTNIGAIGDRVKETGGGFAVDMEDIAAQVKAILNRLLNEPEEYMDLCRVVRGIQNRTTHQMSKEYEGLYSSLTVQKQPCFNNDTDEDFIKGKIEEYKRGYFETKSDTYDHITPRLSLVLCTYMGRDFLNQQLQSISEQTMLPDEIILVDDNSSDDTYEYACSLLQNMHIPYLARKNLDNKGFVGNFENAILLARGAYIALCDQDDVWLPNKNDRLYQAILSAEKKGSEVMPALSFCDCMLTDRDLNVVEKSFCKYNKMHPRSMIRNKYALSIQNVVTGMSCMFNAALLKKAMPMPAGMLAHDWWLALVAAFFGKIVYVDEALVYYRQHDNNQLGAPINEPAIVWIKNLRNLKNMMSQSRIGYRIEQGMRIYHIRALKQMTGDHNLDLIEYALKMGGKKITARIFFMGATPADWRRKIFFVLMLLPPHEISVPKIND